MSILRARRHLHIEFRHVDVYSLFGFTEGALCISALVNTVPCRLCEAARLPSIVLDVSAVLGLAERIGVCVLGAGDAAIQLGLDLCLSLDPLATRPLFVRPS